MKTQATHGAVASAKRPATKAPARAAKRGKAKPAAARSAPAKGASVKAAPRKAAPHKAAPAARTKSSAHAAPPRARAAGKAATARPVVKQPAAVKQPAPARHPAPVKPSTRGQPAAAKPAARTSKSAVASTAKPSSSVRPPAVRPPAVRAPAVKPTAVKPSAGKPVAAQPVVAQPIVAQPIATQPIVTQPIATQPDSTKPVAAKPVPARAATVQPAPIGPETASIPAPESAAKLKAEPLTPMTAPKTQPVAAQPVAAAGSHAPADTPAKELSEASPPFAPSPAPRGVLADAPRDAELAGPDETPESEDEAEDERPIPPRPPAKLETFAEGDHVVYPTHGVGKVEKIAREEIAGHKLELIHITFEENRMTLRVPVDKARSAGLRKLSTRKMFDEALAVLRGRARIKRTMWSRRAQEYEAKINSGDPLAIAEVVRDLHRNAGQPDQSFSERQIYESALDRLAAELGALDATDKPTAVTKLGQFLKTVAPPKAAEPLTEAE